MSAALFVAVHYRAPWAVNVVPHHEDATPKLPVNAGIAQRHNRWFNDMRAAGWQYGHVLDAAKKTHPDMLLFSCLSEAQRLGVARAFDAEIPLSLDP